MDLLTAQMAERRERILAAARRLIAARGLERLTMRDLARAAGITVPTIYNLIGSKEQVLVAAVEEQTARFLAGVEAEASHGGDGPVLAVVDACSRELLRLPDYYRSLLATLLHGPGGSAISSDVATTLLREIGRGLERLRAQGALADWVDRRALAAQLASDLNACSLRWVAGELDGERFAAASAYGACLTLLGVAREPLRERLALRARREQALLARGRGRAARITPSEREDARCPD